MKLDQLCYEKRVKLMEGLAKGEKVPIPKIASYAHRVQILNIFLKLGLVGKEEDKNNGRRNLWSLTEKGRKIWNELFPIMERLKSD